MEHFGYFVTESSGHASEYAPYFRKSARMVEEELVPRFTDEADHWFDFGRTGGYLRHCLSRLEETPDGHEASPHTSAPTSTARTSSRRWRQTSRSRSTATCPTAG